MIAEERTGHELHIDDTIVFLAFRYCLSAQSYAVGTCATYLVQH